MNRCAIKIPTLKLFGYHGCYEEEKKEGQEFEVNMEINISSEDREVGVGDNLEDTINYVDVVNKIKEEFNKHQYNLLESLASRLADVPYQLTSPRFLGDNIISVKVGIKKYNPKGIDVPYVEVEYVRNDE